MSLRQNKSRISEKQKIAIALGLIEMRKAGKFEAVFIDGDRIRVLHADDRLKFPRLTSWDNAERRVAEFFQKRAGRKVFPENMRELGYNWPVPLCPSGYESKAEFAPEYKPGPGPGKKARA